MGVHEHRNKPVLAICRWYDPTAPVVVRPILLAMASRYNAQTVKFIFLVWFSDPFTHTQRIHRLLLMVLERYASYFNEHKKAIPKTSATKALIDRIGDGKGSDSDSSGLDGDGVAAWKVMTSAQTSMIIQLGISALRSGEVGFSWV